MTLDGTVQKLSVGQTPAGIVRHLQIQADSANANLVRYGGATDTLSATEYGGRIEIPVTSIPAAPTIIESSIGILSLADFQVLGTNTEKIHVLYITP